jgi:serine/threonine protein kinase
MLSVLKSYCTWEEEDIVVKNIPHALSNEVYQVIHKSTNEMILVRVYLDQERAKSLDLKISKELGELGLGPKILSACPAGSCEEWIKGRTMSYEEMLSEEYMNKLASAIRVIHDAGITHNDLHHNNFMIDDTNAVRLIDFEYAKRNSTDTDILLDLANHFCEWMYNYNSEDWHIPRQLGDQFDDLAMRFLTTYYSPDDPPEGCLAAILAQQYHIHVKWIQWGLDFFDHTQEQKYLSYAVARARIDPDVMAAFSKETKWLAHL